MSQEASQPRQEIQTDVLLPRIVITYCTQCHWMLRAAYFAQELLSTFSLSLGEVALRPATGGTFTIDVIYSPPSTTSASSSIAASDVVEESRQEATTSPTTTTSQRIWDFKTERTFPEVKILKRRVRDIIDPDRDLGHVDKHTKRNGPTSLLPPTSTSATAAAPASHPNPPIPQPSSSSSGKREENSTKVSAQTDTHPEASRLAAAVGLSEVPGKKGQGSEDVQKGEKNEEKRRGVSRVCEDCG